MNNELAIFIVAVIGTMVVLMLLAAHCDNSSRLYAIEKRVDTLETKVELYERYYT